MNTFGEQIKELEKKQLKIGINYKFSRVHGNKDCVKVVSYDNEYVHIIDKSGITHPVELAKFTTDNFLKGNK